jgi:hypothetical protein
MRKVLGVAALVAVGLLLAAPPAGAGAAKGPTLRSLQAQIKGLQKQVTTLKKRVVRDENFIDITLAYSVCSTAVTADTLQDTWSSLDLYFPAHGGSAWPAYFGPQTAVNDYQACSVFSVVRAHNQHPANANLLRALLDIFKPSSSAATHQGFMNLPRQHGYLFGQLFVLPR